MGMPLQPIYRDCRRLLVHTEGVVRFAFISAEFCIPLICFARKTRNMKIKSLLVQFLLLATGCTWADAPFTVSADGTEVTDGRTGLVWRRCAEGMTATGGTCTGTASSFTHEQALAQARDQATSTSVAWRLPNVRELVSIVDRSKSNPAIDTVAFPATPAIAFWSSSPKVGDASFAWVVRFDNVVVGSGGRSNAAPVRLVRADQ